MKAIKIHHVKVGYVKPEGRTAVVLEDVSDASFHAVDLQRGQGGAALFALRGVGAAQHWPGVSGVPCMAAHIVGHPQ